MSLRANNLPKSSPGGTVESRRKSWVSKLPQRRLCGTGPSLSTVLFNKPRAGSAGLNLESEVLAQTLDPIRKRLKNAAALAAGGHVSGDCKRPRPGLEDGQATLEMLISFMVAFSLVFWLFELCMFTYTCSVLNDAAQEGVRYATMHGINSSNCSGPDTQCANQSPYSNVQAVVITAASASMHNLSAMAVTVSYANSTAAVGNPVAVTVAYTYVPYFNLPGLQKAITLSSQGEILY